MAHSDSVERTGDQDIDGLLTGVGWDTRDLTFSFPTSSSHYGSNYGVGETQKNFQPLSPIQRATVYQVLGMISSVTELNFVQAEESDAAHATLRLARSDAPGSAWTYSPGEHPAAGDVWFRTSASWFDNPVRGSYGFYAFIHEIAHAVGLKHGNETGGFGAMTTAHDSMEFSVATYRSYVGAEGQYVENETWGYAQTLMMYDIAALQHMYGANYTTNSGNTVYRWHHLTGQAYIDGAGQGAPGANRILMTVWDGGGVDTYDFANYRTNLKVDLRPGAWSVTSTEQIALLGYGQAARGNIANALLYQDDARSLVENATGGAGDDRIIGNMAANLIRGRGGADRLYGLEGDDTLSGGSGRDVLTTGPGEDIVVFDARPNRKSNLDRITDFKVADDTIHLEDRVFTKLGCPGKLGGGAFRKGSKPQDSSDRIMYDKKNGALFYDEDGTGKAPQILLAYLPKGLKVTPSDFFVI